MSHVPRELQTQDALLPLVEGAQAGDADSMRELSRRMRPLVMNLVRKYRHGKLREGHGRYNHEDREEIEQEAWLGLMDAVERYDANHPAGKPFWTVAGYRITEHIMQWQARNSGAVPLPKRQWTRAYQIDKALEEQGMEQWEEFSDDDLAAATGVRSAGPILRARTKGITLFTQAEDTHEATSTAEEDYWQEESAGWVGELVTWLDGLDAIPEDKRLEAVQHKLAALGLDLPAHLVLERRNKILEEWV